MHDFYRSLREFSTRKIRRFPRILCSHSLTPDKIIRRKFATQSVSIWTKQLWLSMYVVIRVPESHALNPSCTHLIVIRYRISLLIYFIRLIIQTELYIFVDGVCHIPCVVVIIVARRVHEKRRENIIIHIVCVVLLFFFSYRMG